MSSESFVMTSAGKTAGQAFKRAVARALYDHGHAGYTGTIAEKDGYRLYRRPAIAKLNPFDLVEIALHPAHRAGAEMSTEERRIEKGSASTTLSAVTVSVPEPPLKDPDLLVDVGGVRPPGQVVEVEGAELLP